MKSDYDTKKAKLDAAAGQVKNYENGFLQETKQLDKEIMTIAEYLMRILEKLDGYQIAEVYTVACEIRTKWASGSCTHFILYTVYNIQFII